jgi:hypothetical protein
MTSYNYISFYNFFDSSNWGGHRNPDLILPLQILIEKLYRLKFAWVAVPPASVSTCARGVRIWRLDFSFANIHWKEIYRLKFARVAVPPASSMREGGCGYLG